MVDPDLEAFVYLIIGEVICGEHDTERQLEQGKSIADHNKWLYDVAVAVAQFYDEQLKMRMDAYSRERKALAESKALKERVKQLESELENKNSAMATEKNPSAWDKASELAAAATKEDRATYEEVRQACLDAIKWEAELDIWLLNAKAESIKMHQHQIDAVNELASYKDKTYIEPEFLIRNKFEEREYDYLYCDDAVEISAQCIDAGTCIWHVGIEFLDHCEKTESLDICTVGELRMFLTIMGLDELAKQIK